MRERYLFEMLVPGSERQAICHLPPAAAKPALVQTLPDLAAEARRCSRCRLRQSAHQVVFGEGNPKARLMLIGEGPGADEDKLGRPFAGKAGELLNKILAAVDISREEVYITNVVKCHPPENRTPQKEETAACLPYLQEQIQIISPQIIVALGAVATQALLGPEARITKMRGTWHELGNIQVMPTYHPAALLRDPEKKRPVWQDIKNVRDAYRKSN